MGIKKWSGSRVAITASIAFVCGCGARSELADMPELAASGTTGPASAPPSCPDDGGAGGGDAFWGCVLHAHDVNGADVGTTTMTVPESGGPGLEGYWVVGYNIAILGGDGDNHWVQILSGHVDTLFCGKTLALQPLNDPEPNTAVLNWWGTATDYWSSTSGKLDVIEFEPGDKLETRPIHFEIHGAPMAPGGTQLGSAPNHATGTFTADVSCRLKYFEYVPPN